MTSGTSFGRSELDPSELSVPIDAKRAEGILSSTEGDREWLGELARENTKEVVTYSRNVTIPVTRLCRNRCAYCGFRRDRDAYLLWDDIKPTLLRAEERGCCEALFMTGEKPEQIDDGARAFLSDHGFRSTPEYVAWLCGRTIDETDLLPHTNIGVLNADEIRELKEVNASMGLMLEDASPRLCGPGMAHHRSPGKVPARRIRTLEIAGEVGVPMTTGLLIGIGQTRREIADSLSVIEGIHERHGHIQEIIIQRFAPKPDTPMASWESPPTPLMLNCFLAARLMFGIGMNLQVPPNIEPEFELFLRNGANDLGGISTITPDYINPRHEWVREGEIYKKVSEMGLTVEVRPPVYPEYVRAELMAPGVKGRTEEWIRRMKGDGRRLDSSCR